MENENIKFYLHKIIEEAKKWASDGFPGEIENIMLRSYSLKVEPLYFINAPKRKGRYGLRFRLLWKDESENTFESDVDIRISPDRKNGPAVSVYIPKEEESEKGKNVKWIRLDDRYMEAYKLNEMNVKMFFRYWLNLINKNDAHCSEIFRYKRKVD